MQKSKDQLALDKSDRRRFFHAVFAHGSARLLSKVVSTPLDRIKVCMQVGAFPPGQRPPAGKPGLGSAVYAGIVTSQGRRGLFRGAATHITGTCLGGVTRLSLLRTSQMWTMPLGDGRYEGFDSYARRCVFLYMAGAAALLVAYPCDMAYTCLAADHATPRRYGGFVDLWGAMRQEQGAAAVLTLYRGFPLCLASAAPFIAIATAVHDALAPRFLRQLGNKPEVHHRAGRPGDLFWLVREGAPAHLFPWNLLVGIAAGFMAQSVTYPLDTLRRRWQFACVDSSADMPANLRECAGRIYADGGLRGFYAGFAANAVKLVPETLALCGVYLLFNASSNFV